MKKVMSLLFILILVLVVGGVFTMNGCKAPEVVETTTTAAAAAAAETTAASSAGNSDVAVSEWKFPFITQLTGEFGAFFEQGVFSAKYALKEINDAGGVRGKPLVLDFMDEGPNPTTALPIVSKAIDSNPIMIIGPSTGPNVIASMPIIKDAKILANLRSPGTGAVLPWVAPNDPWCISFLDYDENTAQPGALEWIKINPEIKTVVQFVYSKHTLYVSYADLQKKALESKGVKVINIDVTEETTNLAAVAVEALKNNPDGFIFTILAVPAANLLKELDSRGFKDHKKYLFFGTLDDPNFYNGAKDYIDGGYMWTYFNEFEQNSKWQALRDAWAAAKPEAPNPTFVLWMDYDAVTLLAKGIEECKLTGAEAVRKEEQAKIREWMINVKGFDFIIPGKCDIVGGVKKQPVAFNQIVDGKKTFLKNVSLSDYQ